MALRLIGDKTVTWIIDQIFWDHMSSLRHNELKVNLIVNKTMSLTKYWKKKFFKDNTVF